MLGVKFSGC
jgi:hypothetical protein